MSYLSLLRLVAPETILAVTALIVLGVDLLYSEDVELRTRLLVGALVASAGCLVAIGWMLALPEVGNFLQGMLVLDPLRRAVRIGILALTVVTVLLSTNAAFTRHVGELFAMILLAAIGMLCLVSANDSRLSCVSLELTSISLYVLAAFNKRDVQSAQSGLKYFLFGGMSAAFTLFGLSFLYGLSGSTNLESIAAAIHGPRLDPLLLLAIVMVTVGFGFKIAAAPFHLWAPDVYYGAPLPSAAFVASGSKVAGFFVLGQVMLLGLKGAEGSAAWRMLQPGWVPVVTILAVVSMLVGNLAALVQSSVRRLLAYSAVAHAGYLLLAIVGSRELALPALSYYALTYALAVLGAFEVVAVVCEQTGSDRLSDFAGLSRRQPILSLCMLVFLLSLAGIPPLAGFFGKFYVFSSALAGPKGLGMVWLVTLALATSAVSLYYYLKVLKQIFVAEPGPPSLPSATVITPLALGIIILMAAGTVLLGIAPGLLLNAFNP